MKADQGFYSLAKRAHYSASITEAKAMRPIDQPKSILIKGKQARSILLELSLLHPPRTPLFLYKNALPL